MPGLIGLNTSSANSPPFRYLQPSSSLKPWCRRTNMGFYGLVFLKTRNFQFPDIFKPKVLIARIHLFQISAVCSLPAPSSLGAAVLIPTVTVIAATFQSGSRSCCLLTSNNFFKTWLYKNFFTTWSPKGKKGWGVGCGESTLMVSNIFSHHLH